MSRSGRAALEVARVRPGASLPSRATEGSAGLDLAACVESGPLVIEPGRFARVPTGLVVAIPDGFEGQVRPRSGLAAKHGVTVLNAPGTIDADYRGELQVVLINHGPARFEIATGDRIAQLVIARVAPIRVDEVDADRLDATERGSGGFGSTGA